MVDVGFIIIGWIVFTYELLGEAINFAISIINVLPHLCWIMCLHIVFCLKIYQTIIF